jgi:hypothetical protein
MVEVNILKISEIYTPWSDWSECTKFCDGGMTSRMRQCLQPEYCSEPEEIKGRVIK